MQQLKWFDTYKCIKADQNLLAREVLKILMLLLFDSFLSLKSFGQNKSNLTCNIFDRIFPVFDIRQDWQKYNIKVQKSYVKDEPLWDLLFVNFRIYDLKVIKEMNLKSMHLYNCSVKNLNTFEILIHLYFHSVRREIDDYEVKIWNPDKWAIWFQTLKYFNTTKI